MDRSAADIERGAFLRAVDPAGILSAKPIILDCPRPTPFWVCDWCGAFCPSPRDRDNHTIVSHGYKGREVYEP